jgi:hypothetical protein
MPHFVSIPAVIRDFRFRAPLREDDRQLFAPTPENARRSDESTVSLGGLTPYE